MSAFTDDDLLDYVFGLCTPEAAKAIEQQAAIDPNLSTQISLVRSVATYESSSSPSKRPAWSRLARFLFQRRSLVAVGVLVFLTGGAWTAWYFLVGPPLLSDNFNDEWFNATLWHSERPEVREENGYLSLMNRGSVVTQHDYPGPIVVSFDWKWIDHSSFPLYSDDLCVVLRTSGKHREKYSHEIVDGVVIRFFTYDGRVRIDSPPQSRVDQTEKGVLPIPANQWHRVRITDDGEEIAVYITGPQIDERYRNTPVLRARCPGEFENHKIAIYNRELVGKAVHESRIDNFEIRTLK